MWILVKDSTLFENHQHQPKGVSVIYLPSESGLEARAICSIFVVFGLWLSFSGKNSFLSVWVITVSLCYFVTASYQAPWCVPPGSRVLWHIQENQGTSRNHTLCLFTCSFITCFWITDTSLIQRILIHFLWNASLLVGWGECKGRSLVAGSNCPGRCSWGLWNSCRASDQGCALWEHIWSGSCTGTLLLLLRVRLFFIEDLHLWPTSH